VVYAPEKAKNALANFFTEANLTALRELALRQAAHQVEERREENVAARVQSAKTKVRPERLLLHLTDDPSTASVIRRGKRVADYLHADCYAVYVARDPDLADLPADKREAVERHIGFASNLHIATCMMPGRDVAKSLAEFAREHRITQLFLSRTSPDLERIIENARVLEVTVVAERQR
jgi:two-component system, OmpR family, sensor histidine kinase KdpD